MSAEGIRITSPVREPTTEQQPPYMAATLVSAEGFEPSTNGLKGHCSAIELRAPAKKAECILSCGNMSVNVIVQAHTASKRLVEAK